jgi:hypothetical protein
MANERLCLIEHALRTTLKVPHSFKNARGRARSFAHPPDRPYAVDEGLRSEGATVSTHPVPFDLP